MNETIQQNITEDNIRVSVFPISLPVSIAFSSVSFFIGCTNLIYIIVCFKAFRRKFFNLMILALCNSDGILGFGCTLFALAPKVDVIRTNVLSCQFQVFSLSSSILSSYTLIGVLCIQRFVTLRSINLGRDYTRGFERFKYLIISAMVISTFGYTFGVIFFLPREYGGNNVLSCNPEDLFGYNNFRLFYTAEFLPITLLIFVIVIFSGCACRELFKLSGGQRTTDEESAPHRKQPKEINSAGIAQHINKEFGDSDVERNGNCKTNENDDDSEPNMSHDANDGNKENEICHDETRSEEDVDDHNEVKTTECNVVSCITDKTDENDKTTESNENSIKDKTDENERAKQVEKKQGRQGDADKALSCIPGKKYGNDHKLARQDEKKKGRQDWEIKAFVTSIVIAVTAIVLTAPFLTSIWIEVITGNPFSMEMKMLLFLPISLNMIINPFIYALRVPEIRREFAKTFACCCKGSKNEMSESIVD